MTPELRSHERPDVHCVSEMLHGFLRALRDSGVGPTLPEQIDFFTSLDARPPATIDELFWSARVTLISDVAALPIFDAVFDACFRGGQLAIPIEDELKSNDAAAAEHLRKQHHVEPLMPVEGRGVGASTQDLPRRRTFPPTSAADRARLDHLRHELQRSLPTISSRRRRRTQRGRRLDVRRVLRVAGRTGGEVIRLCWDERPPRLRRVLLLVDVSASLRQHSFDLLRFAHVLVAAAPRTEVFTFGTRLTRITRALAVRDVDRGLDDLAQIVLDADGGTRIGVALQEFLADNRFAATARGALIIVLSDGLERGDVASMQRAVKRLSHLSLRILWWSPLACDPAYRPVTRGIEAILPSIDHLAGARDLSTLLERVRELPRACAGPRRAAVPAKRGSTGHAHRLA